MSSVRYLIADFENFQELIDDALVVNPEKVWPEDTELGLLHPGLRYNKNLEEEGMLTIVMEWFPGCIPVIAFERSNTHHSRSRVRVRLKLGKIAPGI